MIDAPVRPGICFTAIVKDEEKVIRRCLESVKPYIDCWVISDTGSSDNTREIIQEVLGDLPGELRQDKWSDFATNRNLALYGAKQLAATMGCRYIMTLDADEELVMPENGMFATLEGEPLDGDAYQVPFKRPDEDSSWHRFLLVRADQAWRYQGAVHEVLVRDAHSKVHLIADILVVSHLDGARHLKGERLKYLADAKVLKREVRKNPKDLRSWFYLGRTLASAGKLEQAIDVYRKHISLTVGGVPDEEVFHSLFQIASIKELLGYHWQEIARAYQEAYSVRPSRAEPLWALAVLHKQAGELAIAEIYARHAASLPFPLTDGLFITRSIYEWRSLDTLSVILAQVGKLEECKAVLTVLIQERGVSIPSADLERLAENLEHITRLAAE